MNATTWPLAIFTLMVLAAMLIPLLRDRQRSTREESAGDRDAWRGPSRGRALLFLDFDGVLHRAEDGSFEFVPRLEELLNLVPDLDVVISSTWRINASRSALLGYFPPSTHDRIVGVTPVFHCRHARQAECLAYAAAAGVTRFVAVDDDRSGFAPDCPWLVLTDRYQGLDASVVQRIIDLITTYPT